jgi:pectin methylesterase-like acyl-CoA thioesterase
VAGGKSGSGGTNAGGTTGAGGATGPGGAGGSQDAGSHDSASTGGSGTDGPGSGTGGKSGSGGNGSGGSSSGGSGTGGSTFGTACPGATQTLTVGSGQQYATVQAAVNAVPSSNSKLVQISVKAGKYKEQVTINKPFVCLTGESATTTTITNALGTNIVNGGTVLLTGNDFSAANIAFENTGGDGSGQAVALMAQGQRQQFRDCRFLSYQDTLYTNTGTQYFRDCFIQGDTDYIFGDATAVFENCTMNNVAEGTAVTAPRTPQNAAYGFVFLGGSLTANPTTSTVRSNHVYLGRPWGPYAAAAFLNVAMGAHIAADGWTTMSDNTLANTHFSEYKSTGAGANPTNATRSPRQLSDSQAASYTVVKVLSPWTPSYSQ